MPRFAKTKTKKIIIGSFLALFVLQGVLLMPAKTFAFGLENVPIIGSALQAKALLNTMSGGSSDKVLDKAADEAGNTLLKGILWVVGWVLYGIFVFFTWIAGLAVALFIYVVDPSLMSGDTGFLNRPAVSELWKFVRDFFNLFFILVLLFSAFSTIFQVGQYHIRKIFLNILLAVLLVNFSYPVSRFLIDVTNVPMYYFLSQATGAAPGQSLGVFLAASNLSDILFPGGGYRGQDISYLIVAIVFMFIFSVTLLVLAIMFTIRWLALVILVIFSSVGFVAGVIPGLSTYSSKWWESFWKYAFFGPAAALMLLVSVKFLSTMGTDYSGLKSIAVVVSGPTPPGFFASMAYFSIPIILLWMTMSLANSFSIAGASTVTGWGKKAANWGWKAPWAGIKWGGRKVDSKVLAPHNLSPKAWIRGAKQYFETQHHEDEMPIDMAKARMHNALNETVGRLPWAHYDGVDYKFLEQNKQKAHYEAQIKEMGGGEIQENVVRQALQEGYKEHNTAKVLAATTLLSRINGLDNVAGDFAKDPKFASTMTLDPATGLVDIAKSYDATMTKILKDMGMQEQEIMKHIHNFGENAKSKGDASFGDLYEPDVNTGKWGKTAHHADTVAGNFNKMKAQTRHDVMHARVLFNQVVDPATGKRQYADMSEVGEKVTNAYTADDENSASRENNVATQAQVDAYEGATSTNPATRAKYPVFIRAYNANEHFRKILANKVGHAVPTSI